MRVEYACVDWPEIVWTDEMLAEFNSPALEEPHEAIAAVFRQGYDEKHLEASPSARPWILYLRFMKRKVLIFAYFSYPPHVTCIDDAGYFGGDSLHWES